MNIVLEGLLYLCGGILRCFDFLTDVWYLSVQPFEEDWLQLVAILLLTIPSFIFFSIFLCTAIAYCCRGQPVRGLLHTLLGLIVAIAEPTGIVMCIFGVLLASKKSKRSDFYIVEGVTRSAACVEGVFESLPQLIIQSYNNFEQDLWSPLTIVSVMFSGAGLLYSCLKLLYALDKMKHIDETHLKKQETKRIMQQFPSIQISPSGPIESEEEQVFSPDN